VIISSLGWIITKLSVLSLAFVAFTGAETRPKVCYGIQINKAKCVLISCFFIDIVLSLKTKSIIVGQFEIQWSKNA